MYLTGFADEAAASIEDQIRITKELGWTNIESRNIGGVNLHDLPEEEFERVASLLGESGVKINCFGSAIGNWAKKINEPADSSYAEAERAIPRMKKLGTKQIRIMSFAVLPDTEDQMKEERFERLRKIVKMFTDEGLTPLHENCMNYGGMSWQHALELVEQVPGLKLIYDTGNPIFTPDASKPEPRPMQSSWEFYINTKEHTEYVHIKDAIIEKDTGKRVYTYPGEGDGDIPQIVADLVQSGYDGGFSIEPHMKAQVHNDGPNPACEETYKEYGRRMMNILDGLNAKYS